MDDGINQSLCSLSHTSVEKAARAASALGPGALIAKTDIQAASRLTPVCPQDRVLLGMRWHDGYYVDGMLPFGLRSGPKIFTTVADALEWCIRQEGVEGIDHYLDDFVRAWLASATWRPYMQSVHNRGYPDKTEAP